jgi:ribosome silencing factor RsfS/YbeB/iojap
MITASLDDDKAFDVVVIDLKGKTTFADYMVVATGRSDRQVGAMADHIQEKLRDQGFGRVPIEGRQRGDWVLLDSGDVVVHLFRPEIRSFYNLEKLWSDEPAGARTAERIA